MGRYHSKPYPQEIKDKAVALHISGKSISQIAVILGTSPTPIFWWLGKAGVRRNRKDAGLLKALDHPIAWGDISPERAWVLGLIFGDGGIKKDGSALTLSASAADEEVLTKVMAILRYWPKITRRPGQAFITVSSRKLVAALQREYGLDSNKCAGMKWPSIPPSLWPHFVRGLLDSDGSWIRKAGRDRGKMAFSYSSISNPFVFELEFAIAISAKVCRRPVRTSDRGGASTFRGRVTDRLPISILEYGHIDCLEIGRWIYAEETSHMRSERKHSTWSELANTRIAPCWTLRHEKHRIKSRQNYASKSLWNVTNF